MHVDIWSDVMCPFCYIGKRRFEKALEQFPHRKDIRIIWKSFQLNPYLKTDAGKNSTEYLAEIKGWSLEYARQMNDHVTEMASQEGLVYDMEKTIVANSFDAHRLIQLAKNNGKGDEMEERLFKAYFTEGRNIADHSVLLELGTGIGLDETAVKSLLPSDQYANKVREDIFEAQQVGARGVPFFVFNNRYAISGAQAGETFLAALNKAWAEWQEEKPVITDLTGNDAAIRTEDGCK